tara:strand:- start:13026 stop:13505 length:480 start_codon:yes stop_codon:yes gene_type:complete
MDEQPGGKTTITVKGFDAEVWDQARAAAKRSGESMGAWLSRAARQLAVMDAGAREILPDERPRVSPGLPPVSREFIPAVFPAADLTLLRETMLAAHAVSVAAAVPVPKAAARHAFALLTGQLRAARGMRPLAPRPPGKPRLAIGQTLPQGAGQTSAENG